MKHALNVFKFFIGTTYVVDGDIVNGLVKAVMELKQQVQILTHSPMKKLFCISGCCLSRGFCSVPGPNLSAAYFQTSEKSSLSIHTKTKLNHKNNITKHNFIPNVQISYSN